MFDQKGLKRNNGCSRLKKSSKHPMNFRRYNVGFCRDPQPGLYQTRCGLSQNAALRMPVDSSPNSLGLKRLAKRKLRDPHTGCVRRRVFTRLARRELTSACSLCQPHAAWSQPALPASFPAMNEALLHVGNLPYSIGRDDLEARFLNAGTGVSASLMTYKFDSRSRGYGFVVMASPEAARQAVEMYNGREVRERKLAVNLARPRTASFVKRPDA